MYDILNVTDDELLALAKLLGTTAVITAGGNGWGVRAIATAMGNPTTHAGSRTLAQRLGTLLNGVNLVLGSAPQLHFALAKGGIQPKVQHGGRFATYNPTRWASEKLGSDFATICTQHAKSFDKCNNACLWGVAKNGIYLIDVVRETGVIAPKAIGQGVETLTPVQQQLAALADAKTAEQRKAKSEIVIAENAVKRAETDLANAQAFDNDNPKIDCKKVISDAKAAIKVAKAALKQAKVDAKAVGKPSESKPATTRTPSRRGRTPSSDPAKPTPRQASAAVGKGQRAVNALDNGSDADAYAAAYKLASDGLRIAQSSKHAKSIQRANSVLAAYESIQVEITGVEIEPESIDNEAAAEADAERDMAAVENDAEKRSIPTSAC